MMEIIHANLLEIVSVFFTTIAAYLGAKIKTIYEEKINTETKEKVVKTCVNAVEQLYKELNGEEKFNIAKDNITLMLNEKGINITVLEMEMMIEEVVNGFNKGVGK